MSLQYAVLGDSIPWGQGLWESDKYSALVAQELMSTYGIPVSMAARYAHSGAIIGAATDSATASATDDGTFMGEIPASTPSIYSQLYSLAETVDPSTIDLILIDGGINPECFNLLLNPLNGDGVTELRQATWEHCHREMGELLGEAVRIFDCATIVTTGYYPIFSAQSLVSHVGVFVLATLATMGYSSSAIVSALGGDAVADLIRLSTVWGDESARALRTAVADIDSTRLAYAHVPFGPSNCLFAPSHWLWGLGSLPALPSRETFDLTDLLDWVLTFIPLTAWLRGIAPSDPVREQREEICGCQICECRWASVGHPNRTGARQYCNAIMRALGNLDFNPLSPCKTSVSVLYDYLADDGDIAEDNSTPLLYEYIADGTGVD